MTWKDVKAVLQEGDKQILVIEVEMFSVNEFDVIICSLSRKKTFNIDGGGSKMFALMIYVTHSMISI